MLSSDIGTRLGDREDNRQTFRKMIACVIQESLGIAMTALAEKKAMLKGVQDNLAKLLP